MQSITLEQLLVFIAEIGAAVAALTVIFGGALKRLDKRIKDHLDEAVTPLRRELSANGGKSLRDDVTAIRATVESAEDEARHVAEALKLAKDGIAQRHEENLGRFKRLERWHSALRWGLIGHLEAHRKGDTQSHVEERLDALRRVDDEYRFEQARDERPDHPIQ